RGTEMKRRAQSFSVSRVLAVLFVLLFLPLASTAKDIPPLTGRIVDQANLLNSDHNQRIETKLAAFEKETGDQVAVLTLDSLDGEAIEDYANKVGRAWALGQKGKDNGVLLLVAKQDRKMRIEVGYGLEPVLTDLQTNVIQNEVIIPYFKKGDFGGGIEAGVDAILSTIQGKPFQPAPEPAGQPVRGKGGPDFGFLLFALFILLPFSLNAARSRSWFLYLLLMPIYFFLGTLVNITVGLVALGVWAVLFPILRTILPKSALGGGRGGPGGWFMGPGFGGGGGGGGWSGGGGGGFSGGGGSFGGGGSSSSW
ncbi:MAG TPA: TPM domain-containing protein, partial [Thermoanaerobaculia bacterium]|nr:TPM domain-containing protein [Thermoanaerobaculia bacterium]